jgi:hypothetical protein
MLPAGATVMFGPTAVGSAEAPAEAPPVAGAAEDRAGAAEDDAAAEAGDDAAADEDGPGAAEDGTGAAGDGAEEVAEGAAGDSTRADDGWLAEQPAIARPARTAQAVAIFTLF